jgi:hypothetical protein
MLIIGTKLKTEFLGQSRLRYQSEILIEHWFDPIGSSLAHACAVPFNSKSVKRC